MCLLADKLVGTEEGRDGAGDETLEGHGDVADDGLEDAEGVGGESLEEVGRGLVAKRVLGETGETSLEDGSPEKNLGGGHGDSTGSPSGRELLLVEPVVDHVASEVLGRTTEVLVNETRLSVGDESTPRVEVEVLVGGVRVVPSPATSVRKSSDGHVLLAVSDVVTVLVDVLLKLLNTLGDGRPVVAVVTLAVFVVTSD